MLDAFGRLIGAPFLIAGLILSHLSYYLIRVGAFFAGVKVEVEDNDD